LGLRFTLHRHGKGAEHFAAELRGGVFDLYKQTDDSPIRLGTRIGFAVPSVDAVITALADYPAATVNLFFHSSFFRHHFPDA